MFWEQEDRAGLRQGQRQRAGTRQGAPEQEFGAGDAAAGRGCIPVIPPGDTRDGRSGYAGQDTGRMDGAGEGCEPAEPTDSRAGAGGGTSLAVPC